MIATARILTLGVAALIFALTSWVIWSKWDPGKTLAILTTVVALVVSLIIASIFGEHFIRITTKSKNEK